MARRPDGHAGAAAGAVARSPQRQRRARSSRRRSTARPARRGSLRRHRRRLQRPRRRRHERPAPAGVVDDARQNAELDVWRITADDGDFLQTLRRLARWRQRLRHVSPGPDVRDRHRRGARRERGRALVPQGRHRRQLAGHDGARDRAARRARRRQGPARGRAPAEGGRRQGQPRRHVPSRRRFSSDGKIVAKDAPEAMRLFTKASRGRPRAVDGGSRPAVQQRRRRAGRPGQGRHVVQAGRRSRQLLRHGQPRLPAPAGQGRRAERHRRGGPLPKGRRRGQPVGHPQSGGHARQRQRRRRTRTPSRPPISSCERSRCATSSPTCR